MQGAEEVDAEVSGGDAQDRQEHVDVVAARSAEEADTAVEGEGIDQECHQRKGLLRVPRPVCVPRICWPIPHR